MEIVDIIKERLSIFKNLYDSITIVDPIDKKKNKDCSSLKIKFTENEILLVTTAPVIIENDIYIVEMIQSVSQVESGKDNKKDICDIENLLKEMNEDTFRDELTGMYNRKHINKKLPMDINYSIMNNQPICLVMADIDFFKNVNDNYGHITGDWVLKDFAKLLSNSIRSNLDWVGRYGGEEFLIVLKNTNDENAFIILEKIRKLVKEKIFEYNGIKIKLTASFGAYSIINNKFIKDKEINIDELINKADRNLYIAKNSGRNKTIIN